MSTRRSRALEALVERGATEGEREAARIALEKHKPASQTRPQSEPPRFRRQSSTEAYAEFFANLYQHPSRTPYVWHTPDVIFRTDAVRDSWTRAQARAEAKSPHVTQMRDAKPVDFPGTAQVDCFSAAEMHRRFKNPTPFKFVWRSKVWECLHVRGTKQDHARTRYYIVLGRFRTVQVPV